MLEGTDPTMERSPIEEKEAGDKLDKQYNNLGKKWESIKDSKLRALRRCATDSSIMVKTLPRLDSSPTNLMSSLQHPSEEAAWKVRTNDLAVIEILRERRAAIESGKLKGRRLFDDAEVVTEVGLERREEICSRGNGLSQECEVRSVSSYDSDDDVEGVFESDVQLPVCYRGSSYSSSSSSLPAEMEEKDVKEGDKVAAEAECKRGASSGRWRVGLCWLALGLIVCAVITSVGSFNGYKDEVMQVPT